jgi:hypothetical protein
VDRAGGPVIDPTENVIALTEKANERQDDLRNSIVELMKENARRIEQLGIQRGEYLQKLSDIRAEHAKEILALETNRLNAIRQVDVLAVSTAAERAQQAIQALATTTSTNAENLRVLVTSTAATIAAQTTATVAAMTERIAALEKSSYIGAGRQAYSDPALSEIVTELRTLRSAAASGSGKSEGLAAMWGYVFGAVMLLGMLITLALRFSTVE